MKQFISLAEPNEKGIIRLEKKDYNYLVTVRRIKLGQCLNVSLKGVKPVKAEVLKIETQKKYIELKVLDETEESCSSLDFVKNNSYVELILLQWIIKGSHMDLAVRQAAEAGVSLIIPVIGEFSTIKKENKNQTERRKRIIREARQQSGSLIDTEILSIQEFNSAVDYVLKHTANKNTSFIMLSEKSGCSLSIFDCLSKKTEAVVLAIGCEGGISPKEVEALKRNNFAEVHFNTNVLRAETAAIYSIAAVQVVLEEKDVCKKN